ncbi:MAG: ParB/RepB/Spo0J family partition protein [Clostridiales bacterium]|jgi:ParB family chromosome partitioning protein|nr:ParB/RepB/Spo0J family partition protein [Clostridiales bacterium]
MKKGLGKGLDALIGGPAAYIVTDDGGAALELDINKIEPNREQPRKNFDEESLNELAVSITEFGIIQPLIVKEENGYYSIVAGERRWRAARIARLAKVPVIIKDYTPMEMLQVALIENLQRKDLNPIEEALCYKRLAEELFFSQDDIAAKVGKSRNSISYAISLLNLTPRVQNFVAEGKLSAGHARALLPLGDEEQFELSERVIEEGLSVRETEREAKRMAAADPEPAPGTQAAKPVKAKKRESGGAVYNELEADLKNILGTRVSIRDGKNKGRIEIEYYSPDELDRIVGIFKKIGY